MTKKSSFSDFLQRAAPRLEARQNKKSEVPFRVAVLKAKQLGADEAMPVNASKSVCLDLTLSKNKGGTAGSNILVPISGTSIFLSL